MGQRFEPRTVDDLVEQIGRTLGPTEWLTITQDLIDEFGEVTADRQWIHVDVERARARGGTIAHGLLTLSLGPRFTDELMSFAHLENGINYGYDRVRFPSPVPVDSRLRMKIDVEDVVLDDGVAQLRMRQLFEAEGSDKPVCVAVALARIYGR